MLLLFIVGEFMIMWYECCWIVLVMISHVLLLLSCGDLINFVKMGWKWGSLILMSVIELMRFLEWIRLVRIYVFDQRFWGRNQLEENRVF